MDLFHPTPDIEVRPARVDDVHFLSTCLRAEDLAEIVAMSGETPTSALGRGFVASKPCWTILYKGEPSAMFGVVPSEDVHFAAIGRVWFLGSDRVRLWGKTFTRLTSAWLVEMAKGFDVLGCVVDARQLAHIRWLRAVGFSVIRAYREFGHLGLPALEMAVATSEINPNGE